MPKSSSSSSSNRSSKGSKSSVLGACGRRSRSSNTGSSGSGRSWADDEEQRQQQAKRQWDSNNFSADSLSRGLRIVADLPCNKVLDHLYVGGAEVMTPWNLVLYNIRQVLSICMGKDGQEELKHKCITNSSLAAPVPVLQYYVNDTHGAHITAHMDSCVMFIHYGRLSARNVLVHCRLGVSRSAAVICGYLMCATELTLTEVLQASKVMRTKQRLHRGFANQLRTFQQYQSKKVWANVERILGFWWKRELDISRVRRYAKHYRSRGLQPLELRENVWTDVREDKRIVRRKGSGERDTSLRRRGGRRARPRAP